MADDITKLTNSITDLVKTLQKQAGSSAQKKANDNEKKSIRDFYLETAKKAQENIGKQKKADEESKNVFLKMAKAGMNMFKKTTIGTFSKVKNMFHSMAAGVSKIFSEVKSHFLSVFGEESEWFGMISAIKDSVVGFAKGIWEFVKPKTPKWAKKMTKYLGELYKLKVAELKADLRETFGKKKGQKFSVATILMGIVAAIGASIGAFMHRYFLLITKLPIFTKVMSLFKGIEAIPFIGKLVKGLKFGFKWLGWPLTLILSVIDFIKGFKESEGETLWDKIKDGLWAAIKGFIELPVKFIGWVIEKVLGWFGVEAPNLGDKMMEWIHKGFNFILDNIKEWVGFLLAFNPFRPVVEFLIGFFSTDGTFMEKLKGGFSRLNDFLVKLWDGMIDFLAGHVSWIPGMKETLLGMKAGAGATKPEPKRYSVADTVRETEKRRLEEKKARDLEVAKGMKDLWMTQKEGNKETQNAMNNMTTIMQNNQSGGGEGPQIRDELDDAMFGLFSYSGGMG